MKKTLSQAGFSLIEMMVVLAVTTSLFCMAMPNPATLNAIFIEKGARRNVSQIYQVVTSDTICHAVVSATPQGTTPPNCGPLDLQMPSALPVVLNGYSYQYALNSDGTWSETATPVNTLPGLRTVTITQAGVLMCSGAACPLQGL